MPRRPGAHATLEGLKLVRRSPDLDALVPRGQRYGFDLVAHVGIEHFLNGVVCWPYGMKSVQTPDNRFPSAVFTKFPESFFTVSANYTNGPRPSPIPQQEWLQSLVC
ncbi:MAG: hypothetical protein O3B01_17895 [Planctomycetota bacterium]|nr:hypothetical protein [Planctomycetota bacterium]